MIKFLGLILLAAQLSFAQTKTGAVHIIPQPVSVQIGNGQFILSKKTVITASDEADRTSAEYLDKHLQQVYGFTLDIDRQESKNYIRLVTRKFIKAPDKDAYQLTVTKDGVTIEGDTYTGTFYGLQTLIQLLPSTPQVSPSVSYAIPFVAVSDYPRFKYRGMHLDVTRHFFPASYVKRYIDYLALHKLNYFHWHLTDDQGWRIEIKKYPELMSKAAYRNGTIVGRYPGTKNDNTRYGGFYTQEEVKDIVAYASQRHITVVPEIEMPGHASAAIAAYPWLSCFPEKETRIPTHPSEASKKMTGKKVQETWGVFEDIFCAGKDSTFTFLQDVMDEVLPLFPSTYIHVGGDEAPKSHWKKCPSCQAKIKAEGLKDEHELQSYFVQRMERYLNAKGKTIIGWDEILEGGLAPNAVVMSWRGVKGGIEAAKQKHYVIMTPEKPMYFDHTQSKNEDSVVIGGFNPIENVYAFEPVPAEFNDEQGKYILGAQANLWTEYIKNPAKVEYMVFPRMSALSEVLWTQKEKKNWKDFEQRLQTQFKRYDLWKANYSKAYYDVKVSLLPTTNYQGITVKVEPVDKKGVIKFATENNAMLTAYTKTLVIDKSTNLVLNYYRNDQLVNNIPLSLSFNKATGRKVSIGTPPQPKYPGQGGAFSLVNGVWSNKGLSHPDWLGWIGDDMEATIDLGKSTMIDSVRMHTLDQKPSGVYLPQYVEVYASSDGKDFTSIGKSSTYIKDTLTMGWMVIPVDKKQARYVKI
ncbi:MAG TPA: family 20 glycosylhydrolase, partial [Flavisolibacter sp.]